jgi:hypothetical protein
MNVLFWKNHAETMLSVRMPFPVIIAYVRKDLQRNQMQKLHANRLMLIFYALVISIVQTMQNVSKVNVSVKMDSKPKDRFALMSMNVQKIKMFVENMRPALMHLDRLDVNVNRVMSEHHQELDARRHVKMLNAAHMRIVSQTD